MDTSLCDVDVQTNHVKVTIKGKVSAPCYQYKGKFVILLHIGYLYVPIYLLWYHTETFLMSN